MSRLLFAQMVAVLSRPGQQATRLLWTESGDVAIAGGPFDGAAPTEVMTLGRTTVLDAALMGALEDMTIPLERILFPQVEAVFREQAWVNDCAVEIDDGRHTFDAMPALLQLTFAELRQAFSEVGGTDVLAELLGLAQAHDGPFSIDVPGANVLPLAVAWYTGAELRSELTHFYDGADIAEFVDEAAWNSFRESPIAREVLARASRRKEDVERAGAGQAVQTPLRLVVETSGGVVQNVSSNLPFPVQVIVADYDDADEPDAKAWEAPQESGATDLAPGRAGLWSLTPDVRPQFVGAVFEADEQVERAHEPQRERG